MDDKFLETVLNQKIINEKIANKDDIIIARKSKNMNKQTADKNASLHDLILMVGKLVKKTMKEQNVIFEEDEGSRPIIDTSAIIEEPHIYYQVISRTPEELKQRQRDTFKEETIDKSFRFGSIYGQRFNCVLQFDIMAPKSVNKSADEVMNNFEEILLKYTHYLKKNGIAEFYFKEQLTDHNLDTFRQVFSVRSIQYFTKIEKLTKVYDGEIFGIDD